MFGKDRIVNNYNIIKNHHEIYLEPKGVMLPKLFKEDGNYCQNGLVCSLLIDGYPNQKAWFTGYLAEVVHNILGTHSDVQDGRHLGNEVGLDIRKNNDQIPKGIECFGNDRGGNDCYKTPLTIRKGFYYFASLDKTYHGWKGPQIQVNDFDTLKKASGYKCQTCGIREGEKHPKYGNLVALQAGHKNRTLPLAPDNTLVQCEHCNVALKNFNFDNRGIPNSLGTHIPFINSDESVRIQCVIWELSQYNTDLSKALSVLKRKIESRWEGCK